MGQGSVLELAESGYVKWFNNERGYGFIVLDHGGADLFFYIAELVKANMDDIKPGTRVTFIRGVAKDSRPKVSRFLEIGGAPVVAGEYNVVDGLFVLRRYSATSSTELQPRPEKKALVTGPGESGYVKWFNKEREYGFVVPDSEGADLHLSVVALLKANMDNIRPDTRVTFIRGMSRDGKPRVEKFLEVDGKPVERGVYGRIDDRFVLFPDGKRPIESSEAPVQQRVEAAEPEPQPEPQSAQVPKLLPVLPESKPHLPVPQPVLVTADEWVTVTLRKLKPGQTCYADSDLLGQIIIPWPVLQAAKVTSARNHDKFRVRCDTSGEKPVALEIKRGG